MVLKDKFVVRLADEQRAQPQRLVTSGERSAALITRPPRSAGPTLIPLGPRPRRVA